MNITNIINKLNFQSFDELKHTLSNEPYNLQVKYTDDHYMLCSNDNTMPEISDECFGIIFSKKQLNKVVCYAFDKFGELTPDDSKHEFLSDFQSLSIQEAYDGTLIKLFWDEKWHVSTKKCIDAYNAYWSSSKSFGTMFDECAVEMGLDFEKLDKDVCYMFVLQHPENRIVYPYKRKSLVFIGARSMKTLQEVSVNIGVPIPVDNMFRSFEQLVEFINKSSFLLQGYILKDKNNKRMIIENKDFISVKQLKGNKPSIKFQYLNLRLKNQHNIFKKFYPEYQQYFTEVEQNFTKLVNKIYQTYVRVFIHKDKNWIVQDEYWTFLNKMHWIHKTQGRRIVFDDAIYVVETCPFLKLAKLLKAF